MAFSKEQLLKTNADIYTRRTALVDVSDWLGEGATIRIRELSPTDHIPLNAMMTAERMGMKGESGRYNIVTVVKGAIDDNGNRLFNDEDEAVVGTLPNGVINKVSAAIIQLGGIPKKIEEAAKN